MGHPAEGLARLQVRTGKRVWVVLMPPCYVKPSTARQIETIFDTSEIIVHYQEPNLIFLVVLTRFDPEDMWHRLRAKAQEIRNWLNEKGLVSLEEPVFDEVDFGHIPRDSNPDTWPTI
jgi:hypothetical protein